MAPKSKPVTARAASRLVVAAVFVVPPCLMCLWRQTRAGGCRPSTLRAAEGLQHSPQGPGAAAARASPGSASLRLCPACPRPREPRVHGWGFPHTEQNCVLAGSHDRRLGRTAASLRDVPVDTNAPSGLALSPGKAALQASSAVKAGVEVGGGLT